MKSAIAVLAVAALCICAWAAGNTTVGARPTANPQSTIGNQQSAVLGTAAITTPQMFSYQGMLTDTLGVPVADTTYNVEFRLYTAPSGGSAYWNETQTLRTRSGLFSALLGSVTPIGSVPDAGALYLGMAVAGGPELTPRLRIASAAYSYLAERAADADLLQGKDTTALDSRYVNEGQASSVTSNMIVNGTIVRNDVAASFKAPYADTADYAIAAPATDSARVAGNSHLLQTKDTTALWNAKTLQGKDTTALWNAKKLQGKDTTGFVRTGQVDAVSSAMIVNGTIVRNDAVAGFKAPYADTADYAKAAPSVDSARVAGNAYRLEGKDTTALWNAKTLQGKDTTALWNAKTLQGKDTTSLWNAKTLQGKDTTGFVRTGQTGSVTSTMIVDGTVVRTDVAASFKAPYSDTADYAKAAPSVDSARVAGNSYRLEGKDTTALWNAKTLQGKDTTGFVRTGQTSSVTSAMIVDGTIGAADLGQMGAASGQVMKWTGSAWAPRNDSLGVASMRKVVQAAGIVCSPNPITDSGTVRFDSTWGDARFVNEAQTNSVTAAMITDTNVTMAKIAQAGATTGQVVKWTGSAWAPGQDNTGGGAGVTNVYQDTGIICVPNPITSNGNVKLDLSYSDGRFVNEGQANSVTSAMITDGNVTSVDIRDTTITAVKLKDDAVTSAKILDGTIVRADVATSFKAPYTDTADYAKAAPASDSARVAGNSYRLEGKDTTALWNAKTLQGKDTTGFVRTNQANSVTSAMVVDGTIVRADVATNFKAPYTDTADYAKAAPASDSARVAANSYRLEGKDTTALWNAKTLQGKDTTALSNAKTLQGKDTTGFVRTNQANSVTSAMIVDGTIAAADLGQMGAASGQVMKWNGSAWAPRNDSMGAGSMRKVVQATGIIISPNPITDSGTVGFDSTWGDGRFVNEGQANSVTTAMITDGNVTSADIRDTTITTAKLKDDAVTSAKILDGTVTSADVRDTTVNTADIKDAAVTAPKLNQMGASSGQVMKWTGSAWAPANDSVGAGGTVRKVVQSTGIVISPSPLTDSGTVRFDSTWGDARFVNESQTAGGGLTGTYPNPTIAADAVSSGNIVDGSVTSADIRDTTVNTADVKDAAVTMPKLNQAGATSGQVIKWTGSAWAPRNDSMGVGSMRKVVQATGIVCSPNPISDSGTVGFDSTWGDGRFVNEGQANSVTSAMITDGNVTSADIRDTTVNTADLKDDAVTSVKILDGSVTSADIRDTTVNTVDVKDAAVTAPKLNQMGAASGQVMKWTGSAWAPRNDSMGVGSMRKVVQATGIVCSPNPISDSGTVGFDSTWGDARFVNESQAAGGGLTGTYPNPTIANNAVGSAQIADGSVTSADIRDTTITTAKLKDDAVTSVKILDASVTSADIRDTTVNTADLKDAAVTMPKINQAGAGTGQVIKWTGSAWAPANDSVGAGGTGTVRKVLQATGIVISPNPLTDSGTVRFDSTWGDARFVNEGQAAGGGLTGTYSSPTIANNAVGSAQITDGSVTSADIRDTTITTAKLKDDAVTSVKILDGSITSADIRDTTVNTADIKDAAVTAPKLNQMGAASGQVMKWTGSAWAPRNDSTGAGDNAWVRRASPNDSILWTAHNLGIARGGAGDTLIGTKRYTHVNLGTASATGEAALNNSHCTVGGGANNRASGDSSVVAGGSSNTAGGLNAAVAGGYGNLADADYSTVSGGYSNQAADEGATVAGGEYNGASGFSATVGGGEDNVATGDHATVPGGYGNTADGDASFAVGDGSEVPVDYYGSAAFNGQVSDEDYEVRCDVLHSNAMAYALDDPLDPVGTIMNQFAVGSPEIVVTFRGSAVIGADGRVVAELPSYFDALCRNPMVQLTGVGSADVVYVAEDVTANRFVIGGKPGMKVYWTVTGERKDQVAEITRARMPVQTPRTGALVGRSISDASLAGAMPELQRLGLSGRYSFRTAEGRQRYEDMLKRKSEAEQHKSVRPVHPSSERKQPTRRTQPQKLQQ